jgi:hypothetical protein
VTLHAAAAAAGARTVAQQAARRRTFAIISQLFRSEFMLGRSSAMNAAEITPLRVAHVRL